MSLPHVSIDPTMDQSLIIEVEKKNILLPSLWSDDMDIESMEVFRNKQLEVTGSCLFRQAEGLAKHWCW